MPETGPGTPRWTKCAEADVAGFEIVGAAPSDGSGGHPAGIYFSPCGVTSYSPGDVAHAYCAFCGRHVQEVLARRFYELRDHLPMFVIYAKTTRDFPGRYVARMHLSRPEPVPTKFFIAHDDLDALRRLMPACSTCFTRVAADDPTILETWM